ncbi:MAG: mannosyl-3-phosphoglycerate synthase [Candidatus Bipolaricaulaceae bacterium]
MSRVLDLESYRSFDLEECIQDKIETRVVDETGLPSPLSISLVVPVRFGQVKGEEDWGLEERTFHRILREVSQLVDLGYLDELVVIDGTMGPDRRPDFRVLQQVVRIAYQEIGLFHDQVEMLNRYKIQGEMARRGYADSFVKVVHQFDRNLQKVLLRYGVSGLVGAFGVPRGKGAALWLSVPIASGDVVAYVDADIVNFQKEFVVALTHPILYSWHVEEPTVKFVKAYYDRVTLVEGEEQGIYGGRVCRLLARPLLTLLSQQGIHPGIDAFRYPLAGEFAIARGVAKRLLFTNDYTIEVAMLAQLYELVGAEGMAQVSLDVFHHIGQPFPALARMAEQIAGYVLRELVNGGARPADIVAAFREAMEQRIQADAKVAESLAERVPDMQLHHAVEEDRRRAEEYLAIVQRLLDRKAPATETHVFPSWSEIDTATKNYVQISRMLRRRAVQSTWARLGEIGQV